MLTLDDILKLPHDPSEEHLRSIGLLPQPPPTPSIVPHLGTGEKIPALSPVTSPAPTPPADWRSRLAATVPHAAPSAPLPPLSPVTAPDVSAPSPEMPATSESATLGVNFPKLAPLNFKERQALPTTSEGVAPGSKESFEAQLQRIQDQKNNPWGSAENHPGILGKIGHYAARIGNIAGDVLAPATMANIPGTDINRNLQERGLEHQISKAGEAEEAAKNSESRRALESAEATRALAEANRKPAEKEENAELETYHDLMTGEKGNPRINPDTQKPYTALEAYEATKQAGAKPEKTPEAERPLGERIGQLNSALAKRYQVLHKGQELPAEYTLPANATQKDYDRLDKALEAEEKAMGTKAQQDETQEIRRQAERDRLQHENETRSDKSFQFNKGELEKMAKPIDDAMARMSRLRDTIGQGTPQADALVAPELLTVMAGGAGSGLRMNEAEIARIVGGRSKWQDLEAAINKWSLDPSTANSITMEQRADIKKLVDAVHSKLVVKNNAINDARQQLISTDDPKEHRRIAADTEKKLNSIDNGQGVTEKVYSQKDVDDAIKAHPGTTAEQIEAAFKKKGWVKK